MSQPIYIEVDDFKIITPFRMILSAPSGGGKSDFIIRLIDNSAQLLREPPKKIVYCYTIMQEKLKNLAERNPHVELHEGFSSDLFEHHDGSSHLLIVVDDMMDSNIHAELASLFIKYSRHRNISCAYLPQNCFDKSTPSAAKHNRTLMVNANEIVCFR